MSAERGSTTETSEAHERELWREGLTMALYVSITLLAALAVLPDGDGDPNGGVGGAQLVGVIWGTTIGLALAHWYAFTIASRRVREGRRIRDDVELAMAQLLGAAAVAVVATIPVILLRGPDRLTGSIWAPALIVGVIGYLTGRASGRGVGGSLLLGGMLLAVGVGVANIKLLLAGH